MNQQTLRKLALIAACGAAAGVNVGSASAQPFVINITGATLQENFFTSPASTNDFIDVDGDGNTFNGNFVLDQLAPTLNLADPDTYWIVTYRVRGSGNGLAELVNFGGKVSGSAGLDGELYLIRDDQDVLIDDDNDPNTPPVPNPLDTDGFDRELSLASDAYANTVQYNIGGSVVAPGTDLNPGSTPFRSSTDGTYTASNSAMQDGTVGWQADIAPLDVPSFWFDQVGDVSASSPFNTPGVAGYGFNPQDSVDRDGNPPTQLLGGRTNGLKEISPLNANTANPDSETLFDYAPSFTPVAAITNFGTGLTQIKLSELQHLGLSGRMPSGENLVIVTRDTGSGTHNAFWSSVGIDPGVATGENVGQQTSSSTNDLAGPNYAPGNRGGSSRMEGSVRRNRLALGYTGAERGLGRWLGSGQLECLAVQNDTQGGTGYFRPFVDNVVFNSTPESWRIGGPAAFTTIGNPFQTNPAAPDYMRNQAAADYIRNIDASVTSFVGLPGGGETFFSPGELLANTFILPRATDAIQEFGDPDSWVAQSANIDLQNFTRNNNTLSDSAYASFGTVTLNGKTPDRTTGEVYSDDIDLNGGAPNTDFYTTQGGTVISGGSDSPMRNRIAGDFNGNGVRDLGDIGEMIEAWDDRNGGPNWVAPNGSGPIAGAPGSDAIIEVLGDFNGDGNFNDLDVRYFADGLALVGGQLDRSAGFEAVDIAAGGNFFGTTLANGSYDDGDSRADVTNSGLAGAPGWQPWAADGVVDCNDITYVAAQLAFDADASGAIEWSNLAEANFADLSADMNGDLVIDQADIDAVFAILETTQGDINLDGAIDAADEAIISANLGTGSSYCEGDADLDGDVDAADLAFITGGSFCVADVNTTNTNPGDAGYGQPDGTVDGADLSFFVENWLGGVLSVADVNTTNTNPGDAGYGAPDGQVDGADLSYFVEQWLAGTSGAGCP